MRARISGRDFTLDVAAVEAAMAGVAAEPLRDHYVVVEGRRYPPKQVIALVTGMDRADFTTYQARSALRRLGLTNARVSRGPTLPAPKEDPDWGREEAEKLRPYRGLFVALKDGEVLTGAPTFEELYAWLERHDRYADSVFRVPVDPTVDTGWFDGG